MITRKETKQLQGLSILAMLCLHLFCTIEPVFVPLVYVTGVPFVYFLGQAADFCVMAYCFCSGYGLMAAFAKDNGDKKKYLKERSKALWSFIKNYWLILVLFACVAIILGKGPEWLDSPITFLRNATSIWYTYNGAWWFVSTYIFMVLLSPWVFSGVQKHPKILAVIAVFTYVISYRLRFSGIENLLLQHIARFGMSYAELLVGVYFYKYRIMDWIQGQWDRLSLTYLKTWITLAVIVGLIVVRRYIATLFVAPASGLIFIISYLLLSRRYNFLQKIFGFWGTHSTNIWLVHMFFYMPVYGGLAYYAKYDVLVFLSLLTMSLCASYFIKMTQRLLSCSVKMVEAKCKGIY